MQSSCAVQDTLLTPDARSLRSMGVRRRLGHMRRSVGGRWHYGYRGSDLLLWSIVWVVIGLGIIRNGDPDPNTDSLLDAFGGSWRALIWIACGVVAGALAFTNRPNDAVAFRFLVIPPALRALSNTAATILGWFSVDTRLAQADAWFDAVVWWAITLLVIRQASRPELPPLERPR